MWNLHVSYTLEHPVEGKDRDEVNRREVCECDGWVCVLEVIGVPSMLRLTRKSPVLARVLPTFALSCEENAARREWNSPLLDCASWTPEVAKKRSVSRWVCKNKSLTNSLCNLPDVLAITDIIFFFVYYESMKRELKIKPICECRCDGRLQTKRFTRLSYTGLVVVELEHLKIKTRLTNEKFASVKGECEI